MTAPRTPDAWRSTLAAAWAASVWVDGEDPEWGGSILTGTLRTSGYLAEDTAAALAEACATWAAEALADVPEAAGILPTVREWHVIAEDGGHAVLTWADGSSVRFHAWPDGEASGVWAAGRVTFPADVIADHVDADLADALAEVRAAVRENVDAIAAEAEAYADVARRRGITDARVIAGNVGAAIADALAVDA